MMQNYIFYSKSDKNIKNSFQTVIEKVEILIKSAK